MVGVMMVKMGWDCSDYACHFFQANCLWTVFAILEIVVYLRIVTMLLVCCTFDQYFLLVVANDDWQRCFSAVSTTVEILWLSEVTDRCSIAE